MIYKHPLFIHFNDADPAGILFFANYFTKVHQAIEHFVQSLDISWSEWFANPDLGVPLRHVEAQYFEPLWAGQNYEIQISIEKLSSSSVTFQHRIFNTQQKLCTELKTVHVFIKVPEKEKTPIPTTIYQKLKDFC